MKKFYVKLTCGILLLLLVILILLVPPIYYGGWDDWLVTVVYLGAVGFVLSPIAFGGVELIVEGCDDRKDFLKKEQEELKRKEEELKEKEEEKREKEYEKEMRKRKREREKRTCSKCGHYPLRKKTEIVSQKQVVRNVKHIFYRTGYIDYCKKEQVINVILEPQTGEEIVEQDNFTCPKCGYKKKDTPYKHYKWSGPDEIKECMEADGRMTN